MHSRAPQMNRIAEIRSARHGLVLTLSNFIQEDSSALSESFLVSIKGHEIQAETLASSFMASSLSAYCESWFSVRSQPTVFRLLSFVESGSLDSMLADAGYGFVDPSLVLYQDIKAMQNETISLASHDRSLWLEAYCDVSDIDLNSQKTHAEILARIPSSSLFAILEDQGQPVACGLGVIHEGCFGIFDLVTKEQARSRGYGTNLVRSMTAWAKSYGVEHSYLQVTAQNAVAIHFYEKLGYRYLYHYWYRVQRSR
jgi:N-acetylglutamate synthase